MSPLIDSEPLLDCLELAAAARETDIRASPYELRGYGYTPIGVEQAAGCALPAGHCCTSSAATRGAAGPV